MSQLSPEADFSDLQRKLGRVLDFTSLDKEPTVEEITSFENILKDFFSFKRRKLSDIISILKKETLSPEDQTFLTTCFKQLKTDLLNFSLDVIDLLDTQILPNLKTSSSKVFFLKIKGDFYRYSAELFKKGESHYNRALNEGLKTYKVAYELAQTELACESAVYLNLCLNFSVFYYAIAKDIPKACEIISETLSKLNNEMDAIPEELQKGLQARKCLLENNLILWHSELEEENQEIY